MNFGNPFQVVWGAERPQISGRVRGGGTPPRVRTIIKYPRVGILLFRTRGCPLGEILIFLCMFWKKSKNEKVLKMGSEKSFLDPDYHILLRKIRRISWL